MISLDFQHRVYSLDWRSFDHSSYFTAMKIIVAWVNHSLDTAAIEIIVVDDPW